MNDISRHLSFECRCLICGKKFDQANEVPELRNHLDEHVKEGYLAIDLFGDYFQIKPHPTGFPKSPYERRN